jgi:PAS domain S-box-containing protein
VLGYFVLRRKDIPFRTIFLLFGAFILACGTTHLMEVLMFWWPAYRLAGIVKLFTALVSWGTVLALVPVTPKALAMRSPEELEQEIAARRKAENDLQYANAELSQQVEALRISEERFRLLVDGSKDYAIFMLDPTGIVASWNPGAERIKQYRASEIVGQHFSLFYNAAEVQSGKPAKDLQAAAEGRYEEEGWRVRKDGSRFWASVVMTALRDESGQLRGFGKVTRDITERKQAEENARRLLQEEAARRAAEEYAQVIERQRAQLRVTLTSIGDAVITTDPGGRVALLNPVAEALTGWTNEEAAGQPLPTVFDILNEKTRQRAENPVAKVIAAGRVVGLANHTVLVAKDGTERAIDDSAAPIRDSNGSIGGVVLVFRDVTEQRKAERSARFLASIVESCDDAIIGKDINGIITSWNRGAERIFGYTAAEAIGRPVAMLAPPDRADEMPAILARLKQGERVEHFDTARRVKDGRLVPMSLTMSPIKDEDGEVVGASKIARDISERKRAEEALLQEKERLHATLTGIGDAVIVTDAENRVTMMNPVAQALTGWKQEAADRPLEEVFRIVNEQTRQTVESPVTRVIREGTIIGLANHTLLIDKDGTERPIDDSAAPIKDAQGRAVGVVLVFRDNTERRRVEEAVRESEARLAAELEALSRLHALSTRLLAVVDVHTALDDLLENAILTCQADFGNIQLYNAQIKALEIVAQRGFRQEFLDYFQMVRVDDGSACAQAMQTGRRIVIEDVEKDPAFEPHRSIAAAADYRSVHSTPLKDRNGSVIGMLSVHFRQPHRSSEREQRLLDLYARHAADLIERTRFEEALKEADRRKDEFLATLAHELRNPLAPILNALQIIRLAPNPQVQTDARSIMERQLGQMVRLIDDLLDVSRITRGKVQLHKEPVELAAVVRNALEACRPLVESCDHELHITLPSEPFFLDADSTRLTQVFSNLLNNAAK